MSLRATLSRASAVRHLSLVVLLAAGCSGGGSADDPAGPSLSPEEQAWVGVPDAPGGWPADAAGGIAELIRPRFGDLDAMIEDRLVRVLVAYNRTHFFIDGGRQLGLTHDAFSQFEKRLNERLDAGPLRVRVVFLPVSRDRLLPALLEGRGDVAAAALTITPERREIVDFAEPIWEDVRELVVTGPGVPPVATAEDLSGRRVYVRESSSYFESLESLNERLRAAGRPEVIVEPADENLETEDILEMVGAGLVEATVADEPIADFWSPLLGDVTVNDGAVLRDDGAIGWAMRPGSPKLKAALDAFARRVRQGTLLGNMLTARYYEGSSFAKPATSTEDLKRLRRTMGLFRKYAERFGFDWLMIAAQAYQESGIDQSRRSAAGAVGVMQILPSTADDRNVGIGNIERLENNIHAGVKYLRFLADRYFPEDEVGEQQTLFAFAAYNAGPGRVARLRREAAETGLDPDVWFDNVEVVAARRVGRETVDYVSNIYKYYLAYRMTVEQLRRRGDLA